MLPPEAGMATSSDLQSPESGATLRPPPEPPYGPKGGAYLLKSALNSIQTAWWWDTFKTPTLHTAITQIKVVCTWLIYLGYL